MEAHTPGPWKLVVSVTPGQFVREYRVRTQDEGMICEIGPIAQEANGRLIAAAPKLLGLVRLILKEWEAPVEAVPRGALIARLSQYSKEAREVIAEVEGR